MRILGFGTYDVTKHPRVGILLDGLALDGNDVVEVNEPLGFSTRERVEMLQRPWLSYRLALRMAGSWWRLARAARRAGAFDAVVVGYLGHFDVLLARLCFPRTTVVLDQLIFAADTARDRGVTSGLRLRLLEILDALATSCADLVLVDTAENVDLLAPSRRRKALAVPVGAPSAWFDAGAAHVAHGPDEPLRVVFYGLFTPLQGAVVIGEALGMLAADDAISVTMIGSGQDLDAARAAATANESVTWIDWMQADDLPGAIAGNDVCLGVFGATPKALRVVPNKVYQGAAAGCCIVTSDTPPQRRALGADAVLVPVGDAAALADALRSLASDRAALDSLSAAVRNRALDSFTAQAVAATLADRLAAMRRR